MKPEINVGLLTGGADKPYAYGLTKALLSKGVNLDLIGGDDLASSEFQQAPNLHFHNLRGSQHQDASVAAKVCRVLLYYARLIKYAAIARPKVFHILWNNKFQTFDRTLLMLYYKVLGKKVVLTAHNVNAGKRDGNDSLLNRLTLKAQYRLASQIFVHTESMKRELFEEFGIPAKAVTVIPFGINNAVPRTDLSRAAARQRLRVSDGDKTILFFGKIVPYKGLHVLVEAFQQITRNRREYRLIIAGEPDKQAEQYVRDIQEIIARDASRDRIIQKIEFVRDGDTEVYFKAADVLALPYTFVYQSGVLFLAYSFGLPVVASDVGSFREDVEPGRTGYVCAPSDAAALARTIETYFGSEFFKDLDRRREAIQEFARSRNSWDIVSEKTCKVYAELLGTMRSGKVQRVETSL